PRLRWPSYQRRLTEHATALGNLNAAIADVSGCSVIVDSSKLPTYAFVLKKVPGLEVHIVHLVRDSRATAFSWQRNIYFQAEDGIRDGHVTGVQTCALPIYLCCRSHTRPPATAPDPRMAPSRPRQVRSRTPNDIQWPTNCSIRTGTRKKCRRIDSRPDRKSVV